MNNEEIVEVLERIEDKINDNVKLNQDIRTILFTILATFIIFVFFLITGFPNLGIVFIVLIIPSLIALYKIMQRYEELK